MAELFKAAGSEYTSAGVQKKWELMLKKGEVTAKGEYAGDDVEVSDAPEVSGSGTGDAEVEQENGDAENEEGSEEDAENEEA